MNSLSEIVKREKFLFIAALVAAVVFPIEHAILEAVQTASLVAAAVLIGAIVLASMRVAHHAEVLA